MSTLYREARDPILYGVMEIRAKFRMGDNDGDRYNDDSDNDIGVIVETRPRTKKPSMYKVLMLNDDYTPMEFVVHVLERFFAMNTEKATQVMLHVHQRGVGICGLFPFEVAETKVTQVMDFARQNQHPLQCTLEKD